MKRPTTPPLSSFEKKSLCWKQLEFLQVSNKTDMKIDEKEVKITRKKAKCSIYQIKTQL